MKRWVIVLLLAVLHVSAQAASIRWEDDLAAGLKKAQSSGRLAMVYLWGQKCSWCQRLEKQTFADASVVTLSRKLVPLRIELAGKNAHLSHEYELNGVPTILFLDGKGALWARLDGFRKARAMKLEMSKAIRAHADYPGLLRASKSRPNDGKTQARLAAIYAYRGMRAEARAALTLAESASYRGAEMGPAYNGVGDLTFDAGGYGPALQLYEKAFQAAKTPFDQGYALASQIASLKQLSQPERARSVAKRLLQLRGADAEHVDYAKSVLQP